MKKSPGPIHTERMALHSLDLQHIEALLAGQEAAVEAAGVSLQPQDFDDDRSVLIMRRDQLSADTTERPWLLRVAVGQDGSIVGRVGFHAPPDNSGSVEIGYRVLPAFRGQGYATELAVGLMEWGRGNGATSCVASVRPDNAPSLTIIGKLGFVRTGQQIDDEDGIEWVFTRPLL